MKLGLRGGPSRGGGEDEIRTTRPRRGGGEDEIRTRRRSNNSSLGWPTHIA